MHLLKNWYINYFQNLPTCAINNFNERERSGRFSFTHMKRFTVIFFLLGSVTVFSQNRYPENIPQLRSLEDSLAPYAKAMIFAGDASARFFADSIFIKRLVKTMAVPGSFYYPFDSVKTVSKLYPADSTFRIFTWQIERDESYFRQYGVIQMRTDDGSLKIFPLFDQSENTATPVADVRDHKNWIGSIYYQLVTKEYRGRKYYTLFGFDDNDFTSTRKWLEVLTFGDDGQPVFGGDYFVYKDEPIKPANPVARFCLEYKKDARARMVYDPELDLIIFDHLMSESNDDNKKYTLIPDGDYEGFKWERGKWVHVDKVFEEQKLKDGQAPVPAPILDPGKPDK